MDGVRLAEDPEQKLRTLMVAAKESGMEVKTLFEYFDKNDDGEITPAEFAAALDRLDAGWARPSESSRVTERGVLVARVSAVGHVCV